MDDFAFRKGHTYGTILVDLERRRVFERVRRLHADGVSLRRAAREVK